MVPSSVSSCLTFTPRPSPRPAEKEEMNGEDVTRRAEEQDGAEEEEADSEEMDVDKPTGIPGSSK